MHLRPAGKAGADIVAVMLLLAVKGQILHQQRSRTYDAHLSEQHVDELWQLVDVRLAHYVTPLRLSRVVLRSLQRVGVLVHLHAAELQTVELVAVESGALLSEEDRTRHGYLRDCRHYN